MDATRSSDAEIAIDELAELICWFDVLSDVSQRVFAAQSPDWPGSLLELVRFLGRLDACRAGRDPHGPVGW